MKKRVSAKELDKKRLSANSLGRLYKKEPKKGYLRVKGQFATLEEEIQNAVCPNCSSRNVELYDPDEFTTDEEFFESYDPNDPKYQGGYTAYLECRDCGNKWALNKEELSAGVPSTSKKKGLDKKRLSANSLVSQKKETDPSLKPPKKWWAQKVKEVKKSSIKTAADFKDLFSSKYANWVKMQVRLLAANNYGTFASVEEASRNIEKAEKDVAEILKKAVDGEVKRLVDTEREDILQDMTENMEFGPNLPQMGPDQVQMQERPALPPQAPTQQPQQMVPPASKMKKHAKMTKELRAAFDKTSEKEEQKDLETCSCPVEEELEAVRDRREVHPKDAQKDPSLKYVMEDTDPPWKTEDKFFKMIDENLQGNYESLKEEARMLEEMVGAEPLPPTLFDEMSMDELRDYISHLEGPSSYPKYE